MKNKILSLLNLLLIIMMSTPATTISTASSAAQIDDFVTQQMARHHLPGLALVITQGNQVIYQKGFGNGITPQTQFYLASVSKSFTAMAIMQLVEARKVDLDAPIQRYLPDFMTRDLEASRLVTVRQLLNQTSGMADSGFPEVRLPQMKTPAERVHSLQSARPVASPGKEFHYFNPNYDVLARLVEVASGQTFSAYLESHIFTPLGMKKTFNVLRTDEAEKKSSDLAQGHVLPFGIPIPANEMIGYVGGSAGVISTAEDLANFLIMQNQEGQFGNQAIVSPESIALMQTPPTGIETNYGMGWFVSQEDGQKILDHNGILSVFYAEVVLLPEDQIGMALLYNASSLSATTFAFPEIKNGLIALLNGHQAKKGKFTVVHWGIVFAVLTLAGVGLALNSLIHLPNWAQWAAGKPLWQLLPGIVWALAPPILLLLIPSIVASGSGRVFSYMALLRSMLELYVWVGTSAIFGLANAIGRLYYLIFR